MRRDVLLAQPLSERKRQPLHHPSRVHKDKRGAMLVRQFRQPIMDALPHRLRRHRAQFIRRHLNAQIHPTPLARLHDLNFVCALTRQKLRD